MNLSEKIKNNIRDVEDFPKPGILFKDITPIFQDQSLCNDIIEGFIVSMNNKIPDAIAGIESRGFLFGILLANRLNIPFILIRKAGKLPYKTVSYEYELEYGTSKIEMHEDAVSPGKNVLIHDDLLATGGTAIAAAELLLHQKANIYGFSFVVNLSFLNGEAKLKKYTNNIISLLSY